MMGTDEYLSAFVSNVGPLFARRLGAITNRPYQICTILEKETGAGSEDRTRDLIITNDALYQLSYPGPTTSCR
jgi:hypothetical protein